MGATMQFALTPEQQQLEKDVWDYLKRTMPLDWKRKGRQSILRVEAQ